MNIKINTKDSIRPLMTLLCKFGFKHYQELTLDECIERYTERGYTEFQLQDNNKTFVGSKYCSGSVDYDTELPKILEYLVNDMVKITIQNVGDYSAVVSRDSVKIYGQTLSFEKVEEIYNAVQTFK
jgi:hypothetical protein